MDLLDQFDRGTQWAGSKIPAATDQLDDTTPCEAWDVRTLLNHMVDTQQFFAARRRGEHAPFPSATPPSALIGDDPGGHLRRNQAGRAGARIASPACSTRPD